MRKLLVLVAALSVFLVGGLCGDEFGTTYVPPCDPWLTVEGVDPCEPDAPSILFSGSAVAYPLPDTPISLREMLDGDPYTWVTHIVLRGIYVKNTSRCTAGDNLVVPNHISDRFEGSLEGARSIKCYMNVHVRDEFVGKASVASSIPVLVLRFPYFDADDVSAEDIERLRQQFQVDVGRAFAGREHVLFLGPPMDMSSQAWRLLGYWDVQRDGDNVVAVHPNRDRWRADNPAGYTAHKASLEMSLSDLKSKAENADDDRRDENDGRIGPETTLPMLEDKAHELDDYYTAVGISEPEAPPPPCARHVSNPATDALLMLDCVVLLELEDELSGERDLKWGKENSP